MASEIGRKSPEDFLREAEAEEVVLRKGGYLKIVLGYASGVGKSFRMLDEARRRRERGQQVVVAAVQPQPTPELDELLGQLEVIPLRALGQGTAIDVDALVRRRPTVCFIDGLAYDNPPGARNPTRWQDAQQLIDAGIKVIASLNIQYIAELREQVEAITGKHVSETVPIAFIRSADEIEIVDAPGPAQGAPGPPHASDRAQTLSKLREIALVLAADVVDLQLNAYLERYRIAQRVSPQERILICITPRSNVREMIEAGRVIAERFHGELIVAYVSQPEISPSDQAALDERLALARQAGARIEILDGEDAVDAILGFAEARRITQLFIGHSQRRGLWPRLWGNPVEKLIRRSRGMDVRVFPH
jgi:two-component system sensor histidine kinase KdpD